MTSISPDPPKPSGAFPPPPGYTVDLNNPADYLHTVNLVGLSVCLGFIVTSFTLRCYAKYHIRTPSVAEDYMCIASFILSVFYIFLCFMMGRYGEGYHAWEVTPENYKKILKWLYASSIVWIPAAFAVKTTLLLLTARVFAVYERVALGIKIYVWIIFIAYLPVQIVKIFICTPISHYWNPTPGGRCLDQPKVFLTDTAIAIITDFTILIIPIPLIWNLRMPLRRKLKIVAMLGAGGAAVAVACFREYKIYVFQWTNDVTGDFVVMNLCGTIELTIGFVCACLPAINLLVEKHLHSRPSSNRPRTRIWPSSKKGGGQTTTSLTATSSCAYGLYDTTLATSDEPGSQPRLPPTTAYHGWGRGRPAMNMNIHPSASELSDMNSLDLYRVSSMDGRTEGWLLPRHPTSPPQDAGTNSNEENKTEWPPRAEMLMAQLRKDPREILVPGRIWDGTCRGSEPDDSV